MKFTKTILLLGLLVLVAGTALADVEIHSDQQRYVLGDASKVALDLAFGEVQVEGVDGNNVEIDFTLTCKRQDLEQCRRRGQRIRLVPRTKKGRFVIGLKNTPRARVQGIRAHIKLRIPKNIPLDVDMAGGEVFVTRMLSNVAIAGAAGDVDIVAPHEMTGQVKLKVVAGKAELWLGDGYIKGSGFPRSVRWTGPGASRINVALGTGDARVRLE